MRRWTRYFACLSICGLLLAGCGDGQKEDTPTNKGKIPTGDPVTPNGDDRKQKKKEDTPQELPKAKVVTSPEYEATCIVKVNEAFPEAKLKDLAGGEQTLSQLRGQKATVILFWTSPSRANQGALNTLSAKAKQEMDGVRYVGIFVGPSAEEAKGAAEKAAATFPVLVDADQSFFNKVVRLPEGKELSDALPRVYLLDAEGKVSWLSLAFTAGDERDLGTWLK
jgi:peroxiredoxin